MIICTIQIEFGKGLCTSPSEKRKEVTVNGKDRVEISKSSRKAETNQRPAFRHIPTASEGSVVVLDAHDVIDDVDTSSIKNYSWNLTTDIDLDIYDGITDKPVISFTAPYVKGDHLNTRVSFELTITTKDGKIRYPPYQVDVNIKRVQRAMIFQGGVALGAYEAGVYKAVVEKLIKEDEDRERKGLLEKRPLFDIVAGTSIGAMNAAIVVSTVTEKGKILEDSKNWEDSYERVRMFWTVQKQFPTLADLLDIIPFYHYWWDTIHNTSTVFKRSANDLIEQYLIANPAIKWYTDILESLFLVEPGSWKDILIDGWYIPSTAEARRRYYSSIQFLRTIGSINVATGIYNTFAFDKFFDYWNLSNLIPARPDNKHFVLFSLKRTLERFAHFPIKTSPDDFQFPKKPRLLLVTVDAKTGDAVTFDSYNDKKVRYHDDEDAISSQDGIEVDHALASGTFPDFFDYPKFTVEMGKENEEHIFWDGGFRSNTPLREVIQTHRDYWLKSRAKREDGNKKVHDIENDGYDKYENAVPDLEVYIADLWPSELKENPISFDKDFVENRKWDLILGDKTDYDQQVANVVTDYVDLVRRLKDLAEQRGGKEEIKDILESHASSVDTVGNRRKYKDLLEGRFRLTKVVRIDLKDDKNQINDKIFDYSYKTIEELMRTGYNDALIRMDMQRVKDGVLDLVKRNGHIQGEHENDRIRDLQENIYRIQELMSVEQDGAIIKRVKNFMDTVQGMGEVLSGKEQASLIAAAKQLQETMAIIHQKKYSI
jgi:NTE family protein